MSFMRSPAFQFYPSNYLGSRAVRLMDAEQRGWYTQLLFESWESEPQATLPNDDQLLRVLAGVNTCSTDVEQRWAFVRAQFKQKGKLIYNARLLEEFAKQDEFREKRREAGRASGEARRTQREAVKTEHLSKNGAKNKRSTSVPLCSDSVRTKDEQKRTLNTPTLTPTPVSTLKEEKKEKHSAHAELMALHAGFLDGPIPDAPAQGKALSLLLEHYSAEECADYYTFLRGEDWRTSAVTWLTVKRGIADWLARGRTAKGPALQTNGHKSKVELDPFGNEFVPKPFTAEDAIRLSPGKNPDDVRANFEGHLEWKDVRCS